MKERAKTNLVSLSIADLQNSYLVVSNLQFDGSKNSEINFLSGIKFGKKLSSSNFTPMIERINWQSGLIYKPVNSYNETLGDYVCAQTANGFQVFFCISSPGTPSTSLPIYSTTMPSSIVDCSDGYRWKYLYSLTSNELTTLSIGSFIPIIEDSTIVNETSSGIVAIHVKNGGFGYEKKLCTITSTILQVSGRIRLYISGQLINTFENFYLGQSAIIKTSNTTLVKDILMSGVDNGSFFVEIESGSYGQLNGVSLEIQPKLEILGNGQSFIGYADVSNNSVSKIVILNQGSNYTRVWARIKRPTYGFDLNNGAVDAELQVLCDPGFGNNYLSDFGVTRFAINYTLLPTDEQAKNTSFSCAAIVKGLNITGNPNQFENRIIIKVHIDNVLQFFVGQTVFQSSGFSAVVDKIEGQFVYLSQFTSVIESDIQSDFTIKKIDLFSPLLPLIIGTTLINIIEHTLPIYNQTSGMVTYYKNFEEITHTETAEEQFRFLVEF